MLRRLGSGSAPDGLQRCDGHSAAEPQPMERGCVRRGPAAAAPKPRWPALKSAASPAANLLRLVLRAHSRAPQPQATERGCVRRGPAAAAPNPRWPALKSAASPATNLLRLVLRAHSRAPEKIARATRILALPWPPSDHERIVANARFSVPEGHRRRLAGGKPAPAGAAPGSAAKRAMPQRGIGEVFGIAPPEASPPPPVASGSSDHQ